MYGKVSHVARVVPLPEPSKPLIGSMTHLSVLQALIVKSASPICATSNKFKQGTRRAADRHCLRSPLPTAQDVEHHHSASHAMHTYAAHCLSAQ